MEKKIYITEEEREKCQKVADAFADLYEMADIVVFDVGRYIQLPFKRKTVGNYREKIRFCTKGGDKPKI